MKKNVDKLIEKMPSLPTTVTRVMEICDDKTTSPADLNKVISMDPVLMGRVMQLINSAYYSRPNKITSLVRAIILLGLNTVKNLALSTAVLGSLSGNKSNDVLNMDGFWEHSLCAAVISRMIAKQIKVDPKLFEEFFIAGLLHDIGKIPFSGGLPKEYMAAIATSDRNKESLNRTEMRLFSFDHQEIGGDVAAHWKISGGIRDAIMFHHQSSDYAGEYRQLVFTVAAADYMSLYLERGFAGNRYPEEPSDEVYKELGITFDQIEAFSSDIKNEIEKARIFLKLS